LLLAYLGEKFIPTKVGKPKWAHEKKQNALLMII